MSYKSLLFCSEEKTARLVTQVLSELDFTVELAADTYATAKKLAEEHFDALVVDCQNEQDASLLFKAARNSTENHSSLSVAVVEGQAGVAKAFRIGANLVLTKPINVEQSKSTLRVARGLLKKNQVKPAVTDGTAPSAASTVTSPKPAASSAFGTAASSSLITSEPGFAAAAPASAPSVPFASLELDKEPTPVTEAADAAVLDSLPQLPVTKTQPAIAAPRQLDKPFVVGTSAAAAAPAVEKKVVEHHAGLSPLVTNEPIIKEATLVPVVESHAAVPTFSTLDARAKESGGKLAFLKMVVAFALLGVAFYLGWQKLPGLLHRNSSTTAPTSAAQTTTPDKIEAPAAPNATTALPAAATQTNTTSVSPAASEPAASSTTEQIAAAPAGSTQAAPAPEDIQLQEMPLARDAKVTVTPKAQPLIVKNDSSKRPVHPAVLPTAPSLDVAAENSSSPIADLVTSNAPLPGPAPGTIRISQGVSQGLLIKKVAPAYPSVALQLHKEGTVEMLATVSKEGHITNIKVLSGDSILARAAVDAVKQWQYRPYLLNAQPLEVETQINISFKLPK